MAPLKNVLVAAFALASFTSAMPMAINARDAVTNTVTETAWVTVDVTKTVYVDDEPTPEPKAEEAAAVATTTSAPVASSVEAPKVEQPVASAEAPKAPAAFAENPSSQVQAPASPATTSPASAASASAPTPQVQPKTPSAPTGGACEGEGSGCTGDVTHWDGGLGACGWNVNTASDMSIALPVGLMGSLSNSNPYCGRSVSIKSPDSGEIIQATVGDKCMGCTGNSIDLTDALFSKVVPNGDGRVSNVEWWFS